MDIFQSLPDHCNQSFLNIFWEEKIGGGFERLKDIPCDLILLDIDGQDCDFDTFFADLRQINTCIPVAIISSCRDESIIIRGLNAGSDDFMEKPLSYPVLGAKINAILRRTERDLIRSEKVTFGTFVLDINNFILTTPDKTKILTPSESNILKKLVLNRGEVCSRDELMGVIRHVDNDIITRNIDVHVASIRKKIGDGNYWIRTVRGIGYRFRAND